MPPGPDELDTAPLIALDAGARCRLTAANQTGGVLRAP